MNWFTGAVLFAVIWFMTLFVILPLRLKSQSEDGNVTPGTPASAPSDPRIRQKLKLTTLVAVAVWALCATVILSGVITVEDLDWFGRI